MCKSDGGISQHWVVQLGLFLLSVITGIGFGGHGIHYGCDFGTGKER